MVPSDSEVWRRHCLADQVIFEGQVARPLAERSARGSTCAKVSNSRKTKFTLNTRVAKEPRAQSVTAVQDLCHKMDSRLVQRTLSCSAPRRPIPQRLRTTTRQRGHERVAPDVSHLCSEDAVDTSGHLAPQPLLIRTRPLRAIDLRTDKHRPSRLTYGSLSRVVGWEPLRHRPRKPPGEVSPSARVTQRRDQWTGPIIRRSPPITWREDWRASVSLPRRRSRVRWSRRRGSRCPGQRWRRRRPAR